MSNLRRQCRDYRLIRHHWRADLLKSCSSRIEEPRSGGSPAVDDCEKDFKKKKSTVRELLSESLSGSSELSLGFVLEESLHHIFTDKCRNAGLSGSQTFFFLNPILNLFPSLLDQQGHGGRCLSVPVDTPNYSHSLELCFMPALAETLKVICNLLGGIDWPGVKLFPLCRTNILLQHSLIKSERERPV